jgi:flagellar M-ring protein FliF
MDFLNRAWAQLGDSFKSLTVGARISACLLLAIAGVSFTYLFKNQASSADLYLMGGEHFASSQLSAMEAAFAKASLNTYELDGNRVRVPRGQQSAYMGALADEGALPPDFGKYLEKALDNNGLFVSPAKQHELLKIAKQHELQLILSRMKGVETASVLYDEKKEGGFGNRTISTASVNIKPVGSQPLEEERIPTIRHLVASAFAGLKPESVSVTDLNGRAYSSAGGDTGMSDCMDDPYIVRKRAHEKDWQRKVRSALEYIPGVLVTANVELSLSTGMEESKTTLDPKPTGGANQPGVVSMIASGLKISDEMPHGRATAAVPATTTKRREHGLTPQRVKISVGIPSSYYVKVWRERNGSADAQPYDRAGVAEIAEIERQVKADVQTAVVALLPDADSARDPLAQVTVTSFQHLPGDPMPVQALEDPAYIWFQRYGTSVGVGGLALVSLLLLRSCRCSHEWTNKISCRSEPLVSRRVELTSQARSGLRRCGATQLDRKSCLTSTEAELLMSTSATTIRKAAILLASLEPASAEALLAQMSDAQAAALREALEDLSGLNTAEQNQVIEEFFRIGPLVPEEQPSGIDLCSAMARQIGHRALRAGQGTQSPFQFLRETTGPSLASRLRQEHPQTIAVVVSHLPPERGAELLASLPAALQADVARRLVNLDETDPEVLQQIERGLEDWLSDQEHSSRRRTAGMRALENILLAAGPDVHEQVLDNLARHDRQLAGQLAPLTTPTFSFEQLSDCDDAALARILRQADPQTLALALTDTDRKLVARAHRLLPVAQAARLRRDLERIKQPCINDVEHAQRQLADLAGDLELCGQLSNQVGRKLSLAI